MNGDFKKLEDDILSLLSDMAGVLSPDEVQEARTFVDVAEYGVALETLCMILKEEGKTIERSQAARIVEIGQRMGVAAEYLEGLKHNWQ